MVNTRTEGWTTQPDDDWQKLYEGIQEIPQETTTLQSSMALGDDVVKRPLQIHGKYILSSIRSGTIIIDQKRAHERIIFEQVIRSLALQEPLQQQQLFPINLEFGSADSKTLSSILDELKLFGINLEPFGKNAFVVQGLATFIDENSVKDVIDEILEEYGQSGKLKNSKRQEKLAQAMARKAAIQYGKVLQEAEMTQLIDELFACDLPIQLLMENQPSLRSV